MNPRHLEIGFFFALLFAVLTLGLWIILPYMSAVILAATFAVVFRPLHRRILEAFPRREGLVAAVGVIVVLAVIFIPLTLFGFVVFEEARDVYFRILEQKNIYPSSPYLQAVEAKIRSVIPTFSFNVAVYAREAAGWLLTNIGPLFSGVAQVALNTFISIFALYYFFKDGKRFRKALEELSPLSDRESHEIFSRLIKTVRTVVVGTLVVAVLQGILTGAGFVLFGVPHPALWGAVAVIAALVPAIGTGLVTFPAAAFLLWGGHTLPAFGLLAWGFLIVGLIDNILRPYLIERGIKIHQFLILLSVLGGIGFFGPMGFLLGPLLISFIFALLELYPRFLADRGKS